MRNSYKYTRLYSGAEPTFTEGDMFTIVIPLSESATATIGPISATTDKNLLAEGEVSAEDKLSNGLISSELGAEVSTEVRLSKDKLTALLNFCTEAKSRREMQEFCQIKSDEYFRKHIITPMLNSGLIERTIPDKPSSGKQRYICPKLIKDFQA